MDGPQALCPSPSRRNVGFVLRRSIVQEQDGWEVGRVEFFVSRLASSNFWKEDGKTNGEYAVVAPSLPTLWPNKPPRQSQSGAGLYRGDENPILGRESTAN